MRENRALALLTNLFGKQSREQAARASVSRVIADLDLLNRSTEQDFLVIGERLAEFYAAVRRISSDTGALRDLSAGAQTERASRVLNRVLEQALQTEARAAAGDKALAAVCGFARTIGAAFRGFEESVSLFRALGSLIRIETARLGGVGSEFESLAGEVNALTRDIESSGQDILAESAVLDRHMASVLARVSGLRDRALQQLPELSGKIGMSLETLDERNRRAAEAALCQAAEYEEISAAVGDLITAIQFHDITRQQITHVVDALGQVPHRPTRNRASLLTLQLAQLANTGQVFAASAGRIRTDLTSIAERIARMAEESETLLGSSSTEQNSLFVQLEERFHAVSAILNTCAGVEQQTVQGFDEIGETVARLRAAVEEVGRIEIRIRHIAINATIRALEIGPAGNALNLLAEVMQRVAADSRRVTGEVTQSLDAIVSAAIVSQARRSSGGAPPASDAGGELGALLSEMRSTTAELHASSEAACSKMSEISARSAQLRDAIHAVLAGFSVGPLFAAAIAGARSAIMEIAGPSAAGPASQEGLNAGLDALAERYTMQSERDIHDAVAAGAEIGSPAGGDSLGENVEFF